jgi:hypothetical protein
MFQLETGVVHSRIELQQIAAHWVAASSPTFAEADCCKALRTSDSAAISTWRRCALMRIPSQS